MLLYATLREFKIVKQVLDIESEEGDQKILAYLQRATRYITRYTRREFFPWYENRGFAIPHKFIDLRMRRFGQADLYMDQDLLEVDELTNADNQVIDPIYYFMLPNNINPKFAIAIQWPKYWGGVFNINSLTANMDTPVLHVKGVWGFHDGYNRPNMAWIDTFDSPVAAVNTTDMTIQVNDIDGIDAWNISPRFQVGQLIKIDDEFMEITGTIKADPPVSSAYDEGFDSGFHSPVSTLQVLRGVRGTTAASHEADTVIYRWRVVEDIAEACIQIARIWREADTAAGGRIGVSEVNAGVELSIPTDPAMVLKSYVRSIVGSNL